MDNRNGNRDGDSNSFDKKKNIFCNKGDQKCLLISYIISVFFSSVKYFVIFIHHFVNFNDRFEMNHGKTFVLSCYAVIICAAVYVCAWPKNIPMI